MAEKDNMSNSSEKLSELIGNYIYKSFKNPNIEKDVKKLLESKANVDISNENSQTPLMILSEFGGGHSKGYSRDEKEYFNIMKMLIDYKANVDLITSHDGSALMYACQNSFSIYSNKIVKFLVEYGKADVNIRAKEDDGEDIGGALDSLISNYSSPETLDNAKYLINKGAILTDRDINMLKNKINEIGNFQYERDEFESTEESINEMLNYYYKKQHNDLLNIIYRGM